MLYTPEDLFGLNLFLPNYLPQGSSLELLLPTVLVVTMHARISQFRHNYSSVKVNLRQDATKTCTVVKHPSL